MKQLSQKLQINISANFTVRIQFETGKERNFDDSKKLRSILECRKCKNSIIMSKVSLQQLILYDKLENRLACEHQQYHLEKRHVFIKYF